MGIQACYGYVTICIRDKLQFDVPKS